MAATGNQVLNFSVRATNEAEAPLRKVKDAIGDVEEKAGKTSGVLSSLGSHLGDVAKVASGFVIGSGLLKLPGFLTDAAKGAAEDAAATERLQQTFRNYANMVGAAPDTFQRLNALLDERIDIGQKLAFTDDQVRDSFNYLLAATDDSSEATKRQAAAMDLARGAGIPLETATKMLGKLTAENVEVFKKMGITIGENATEADALAAVQARFGGQAEAYAKSTAGQFEQTSIRMSELKEQIGAQLLPVMAKLGEVLLTEVVPRIEEFANYWATSVQPKLEAWWNNQAKPTLQAIWQFIETEVMPRVQEQWAKFQVYFDQDIKPALDNIKTALEEVVTFLIQHWSQIEPFVKTVTIPIETAFRVMKDAINILIQALGGDWDGVVQGMKKVWEDVVGGFEKFFSNEKDKIVVIADAIGKGFAGIADEVETAFRAAVNKVIEWINKAIEAYNKIPIAPDVDTIPPIGGSGPAAPAAPGPVYGPATPIYGPETPDVYERGIFGQQMPVPFGAYGQSLEWDPEAQAYVYPGSVGSIGAPNSRLSGTDVGWVGGIMPSRELTINIQAMDARSFGDWLTAGGGGEALTAYVRAQARYGAFD